MVIYQGCAMDTPTHVAVRSRATNNKASNLIKSGLPWSPIELPSVIEVY